MAGQVNTTAGAVVTVKEALHVLVGSHELVTVNVTVFVPPQNGGAPVLLLYNDGSHPPLVLTVASHAAYCASTADCV